MSTELPPQRKGPGGGTPRNISPAQGAQEAERRLGRPCFHVGQIVAGLFQCVTCQFHIRNRKALPACPDCGELVWAYMEEGPRPVPEGESASTVPMQQAQPAVKVQENVRLDAGLVKVQENVRLEP